MSVQNKPRKMEDNGSMLEIYVDVYINNNGTYAVPFGITKYDLSGIPNI